MKRIILTLIATTLALSGVSAAKKKHHASGTSILTGRVIGDHGRPAHHARVTIRHARRHHRRHLGGDAAGRFTVGLGPGRYRVSAREGKSSGATWAVFSAGKTTSVVIALHHAGPHAVYVYERHHLGVHRRRDWRRRHDRDHGKTSTKTKTSSKSTTGKPAVSKH